MDTLFNDFPSKYEELSSLLNERREKQLKERGKVDYQVADIDKSKMQDYARRAAEEAARWNAALNKEKKVLLFDIILLRLNIVINLI